MSEIVGHKTTTGTLVGSVNHPVLVGGGGLVVPGHALYYDDMGRLSVDVSHEPEPDNTLPITSAAVAVSVGNIDALLKTI